MTGLTEFLFPAPARRRVGSILGWWESRRVAYNLVVGGTGVLSLGVMKVLTSLPPNPHGKMGNPLGGIALVAVMANVCYLLGPAAEVGVEKFGQGRILPTGPALYRMGLTFSTGLVLLPSLLVGFDWLFRVARALF
jgi:hypothetical protein